MGKLRNGVLNERYEIANLLRGQQVDFPDLHQLFEGWPEATNVHVDSLRIVVNENLDRLFPPGKRQSKLKAADYGLFGAMWWPYASFERLCIATYLGIWLFAWDDEMDSLEFSDLSLSLEEARAFRATTVKHVRTHLALDSKTSCQGIDATQSATRNSILGEFAPVGHAAVKHYTLSQRQSLMQEIDSFVEMCGVEQRVMLSGELPSVESYQRYRMGTSGVAVCVAIHEYALGIQLPQHVILHPMMKILWDETNIIISVANDMLSLKKEIAQNQVDTLIPLLYFTHDHDLQAAVDEATEILKDAVARFDIAATGLFEDTASEPTVTADVVKFIDSCRYACTANLNWSLRSGRYGLHVESLRGGISLQV